MDKNAIAKAYSRLNKQINDGLDEMKSLMATPEFQKMIEEEEETIMYGCFEAYLEGLAEGFKS